MMIVQLLSSIHACHSLSLQLDVNGIYPLWLHAIGRKGRETKEDIELRTSRRCRERLENEKPVDVK